MADQFASLPFDEAIAFLRDKISLDTERWDDILDEQHTAFFVVAGAKAQMLADLRATLERAIANGQSLAEFKESSAFQRFAEGWTDAKKNWRSKIIFETNLRQSYSAGRYVYQSDPEVVKLLPFLRWVHGGSRFFRPPHLAANGSTYEVGRQPMNLPNGFGCRCRYISLSREQFRKQQQEGRAFEGTGKVEVEGRSIPLVPEKGFDYLPTGEARRQAIRDSLDRVPSEFRDRAMREMDSYET